MFHTWLGFMRVMAQTSRQESVHTGNETTAQLSCPICMEEISEDSSFKLKGCNCTFCLMCLREMVLVNIKSKTVHLLRCPVEHDVQISRAEVKRIADPEAYISYLRLTEEAATASDPSRVFCPRPGCSGECRVSPVPGPRPTRCTECGWKFCRSCKDRWPGPGHVCPVDLQSDVAVDTEEETGTTGTDSRVDKKSVRVKRCPRCGIPVTRDEGCPQMSCPRCAHVFCWDCMADLSKDFLTHFEHGECRQCNRHVWAHRFLAAASMFGLGCVALIVSPFLMFCAPCFIMCGNDIFSGLVDLDGEFDNNLMRTFMRREWEDQMSGENTDDEEDNEDYSNHGKTEASEKETVCRRRHKTKEGN